MSDQIKELVKRLRVNMHAYGIAQEAADALEAMAGEVARETKAAGYWMERSCTAENERDRLAGDLSVMRLKLEAKLSTEQSEEIARLKAALVEQVKQYPDYSDICRKALGDAS